MRNHVSMFDDFTGYDVLADIWNGDFILGANSAMFITQEGDDTDVILDGDMEALSIDVIVDGDMEAVGVGDWSVLNNALLTKDTTAPLQQGTQHLRVAYIDTDYPVARQLICTVGKTYRMTGYARGDGTHTPRIINSVQQWIGTTSTSWQAFDLLFVAAATDIQFKNGGVGAGFCEWDDVEVLEQNGDWLTINNPTVTKETVDPYEGLQTIKVLYTDSAHPGIRQSSLVVGNTYRITGQCRQGGVGNCYPRIFVSTSIFSGNTSTSWQDIDIIFVATAATLYLYAYNADSAGEYVEYDDIEVLELSNDRDGTLTLLAGDASGDYVQADLQHTNQFRRANRAIFEARFRLSTDIDLEAVLGFSVDDHLNTFGVRADNVNGDFRVYSRVADSDVVNAVFSSPVALDYDWHTIKVACNGELGTVDVYFDGVLQGTIANANLPLGDLTPSVFVKTWAALDKIVYVDYIAVHQARASRVRYVGDIADSNIENIGEGVDEYLIGMGTTGTDAGEVWAISADYSAASLGNGGGTLCTTLIELNGDIYAGFNDSEFYKWAGGTSWSALSFANYPFDVVKWKDDLYVGTNEASARATVHKFDNPGWTDIGSAGWTNETDTAVRMCIHDNKLYAIYLSDNEVFEYVSGTTWTSRGNPGGVTTATLGRARSVFSFKGDLYAVGGATDNVIYKWGGGTTWTAAYTAVDELQKPVVCNGGIVVLDRNTSTGEITVLTSPDGARFVEVDSFTPSTNADVATGRARGAVVAGLTSIDAKVWEIR